MNKVFEHIIFKKILARMGADGFKPLRLNGFDKWIAKEHKGNYNRMSIMGIWVFMGGFVILAIPIMIIFFANNAHSKEAACIIMGICLLIGLIPSFLYNLSCDKIDYNYEIDKQAQLNFFRDFGAK